MNCSIGCPPVNRRRPPRVDTPQSSASLAAPAQGRATVPVSDGCRPQPPIRGSEPRAFAYASALDRVGRSSPTRELPAPGHEGEASLQLDVSETQIRVRARRGFELRELRDTLDKVRAAIETGAPRAIAYDLRQAPALGTSESNAIVELHRAHARFISRAGFCAAVPLVRGSAIVIAAAVREVLGGVFSTERAMSRWLSERAE